jgi:hypothetical protein
MSDSGSEEETKQSGAGDIVIDAENMNEFF